MGQDPIKHKMLYINHDFPPMSGPGVWRAKYFTKYLSKADYKVTIICGTKSHWFNEYDESLGGDLNNRISIIRIRSIFPSSFANKLANVFSNQNKDTHFRRIIKIINQFIEPDKYIIWAIFTSLESLKYIFNNRNALVFTSGPPHLSHLAGLIVKLLLKNNWIMDYRDLWFDDPVQSKNRGFYRNLFKKLEKLCVKHADAVVTVSPFWKNLLEHNYQYLNQDKFFLIRNGHHVDPNLNCNAQKEKITHRLHIHYNGVFQELSKNRNFIKVLKKIKRNTVDEKQLPLITFTGISPEMKDELENEGLGSIIKNVGYMNFNDSIKFSLKTDALLVIVNNDNFTRRGNIPAKIYEAMALGKRIIAIIPEGSDIKDLLREFSLHDTCNIDDPNEIYKTFTKLMKLYENKGYIRNLLPQERQEKFERYSRKKQSLKLKKLIEDCLR